MKNTKHQVFATCAMGGGGDLRAYKERSAVKKIIEILPHYDGVVSGERNPMSVYGSAVQHTSTETVAKSKQSTSTTSTSTKPICSANEPISVGAQQCVPSLSVSAPSESANCGSTVSAPCGSVMSEPTCSSACSVETHPYVKTGHLNPNLLDAETWYDPSPKKPESSSKVIGSKPLAPCIF